MGSDNKEKEEKGHRRWRHIPPGATTLVVRNIPCRCTQDWLCSLWGPKDHFDLLHLPFSPKLGRTVGYAFVNFLNHEKALAFREAWHGKAPVEALLSNSKPLDVAVAHVQGYAATLELYRCNRPAGMKNRNSPLLFRGGGHPEDTRESSARCLEGHGEPEPAVVAPGLRAASLSPHALGQNRVLLGSFPPREGWRMPPGGRRAEPREG